MANYLTTDAELASVADAIRAKSGASGSLIYPAGFVSAIENIKTGGATENDVNFYDDLANDCNGGIVYSYSAAEFAALTQMPNNPDHSNFTTHGFSIPMTSQGWNWSLADAKAYVAKYGKLNIGQTYMPTDGKSHYICYVPEDAPVERWNTVIHIDVSGGSVNWQIDDGTVSTANDYISVTFPSVGWHDVKLEAPSGVTYYPFFSVSSKSNELKGKIQKIIQVFCGDNVTSIGYNAFGWCYSLTSLTIPDGVTSMGSNVFNACYSLASLTIPDGVTSIGGSAFSYCYSLKNIIMESSTPPTLANTSAFNNLMTDYSIIVPAGSRSSYISTTNWSSLADHIVEASA